MNAMSPHTHTNTNTHTHCRQITSLEHELEEEKQATARALQVGTEAQAAMDRALARGVSKGWRETTGQAPPSSSSGASNGRRASRTRARSGSGAGFDGDVGSSEDWSTLLTFLNDAGQQSKVFAPGASAAASLQEISAAVGILETCAASAQRLAVVENESLQVRRLWSCYLDWYLHHSLPTYPHSCPRPPFPFPPGEA